MERHQNSFCPEQTQTNMEGLSVFDTELATEPIPVCLLYYTTYGWGLPLLSLPGFYPTDCINPFFVGFFQRLCKLSVCWIVILTIKHLVWSPLALFCQPNNSLQHTSKWHKYIQLYFSHICIIIKTSCLRLHHQQIKHIQFSPPMYIL